MPFMRRHPAGLVGILAALLAFVGSFYRQGLPTFIADWVALTVALAAVGLAAAIVFAWARDRLDRLRA